MVRGLIYATDRSVPLREKARGYLHRGGGVASRKHIDSQLLHAMLIRDHYERTGVLMPKDEHPVVPEVQYA